MIRLMYGANLHYDFGELDAEGRRTDAVQRAVLDTEHPDLVVVTGDALSGTAMSNYSEARIAWSRASAVLREKSYKWALTFGNHDDDGPAIRKSELVELDMALPGSLTQRGPAGIQGLTNYVLPVFAAQEEVAGEAPAALLWVLDVQPHDCDGVRSNGCVTRGQVEWFLNESRAITARYSLDKPLFSFMFFHIPIPEFVDVWNNEVCFGSRDENVACPRVNTGVYEAAYSQGVRGIFVGHNHRNDYCGALRERPTLSLCFGRKTGHGYYNPEFPMTHGARIIESSRTAR
eukprot:m51a1_g8185 hypothetical protein (289) ;mRNA; f:150315-151712